MIMTAPIHIYSEIGHLKTVMLKRPGENWKISHPITWRGFSLTIFLFYRPFKTNMTNLQIP